MFWLEEKQLGSVSAFRVENGFMPRGGDTGGLSDKAYMIASGEFGV